MRSGRRHELLVQPAVPERVLRHTAPATQASASMGTHPEYTRRSLELTECVREVLEGVARGERSRTGRSGTDYGAPV